MKLHSSAFADGGRIPSRYTCDGDDISPPLSWSGIPANAKSLVLIVDDPDAPDPAKPQRVWVHWLLYNLPPVDGELPSAVRTTQLPHGTLVGTNDGKRVGYGGPCPPIGRHRYFHKLYALDVILPDLKAPHKAALESAMDGHVLAEAQLMGTYARGG